MQVPTLTILESLPKTLEVKDEKHKLHRLVLEHQDDRWMLAYVCTSCKGRLFSIYGAKLDDIASQAEERLKRFNADLRMIGLQD